MSDEPRKSAIRRLSMLFVVDDVEAEVEEFTRVGMQRIDTGDPRCVGLRAGRMGTIVASPALMEEVFGPAVGSNLRDETIPYLHVSAIEDVLGTLGTDATVVGRANTPPFGRLALIRYSDTWIILSERSPDPKR